MRKRKPISDELLLEFLGLIVVPDRWGYPRTYYWYNVFDDPLPKWAIEPGFNTYANVRVVKDKLAIWEPILLFALEKGYISQEQFDHLCVEIPARQTLLLLED